MSQNNSFAQAMSLPFRIGQGFDVHALVENRPLIIAV